MSKKNEELMAKKSGELYTKPEDELGDNAMYLRNAMQSYCLPPIDINDEEQVEERIEWYFNHCIENNAKPGMVGLSNALGVSRMTFFNWMRGKRKTKPEHQNMAIKAKGIIEEMMEQYMMNGKINPVSGIFLMKNNFDGYYDRQDVVLSPGASPIEPQKDVKELEKKYSANDIDEE